MTKEDLAHTMATLLSLDRVMISDLMKLQDATLAKMYTNYIQNAKDANNHLERQLDACEQRLTSSGDKNRSTKRSRKPSSN